MQEFSFLEAVEFDLGSNPFAVRSKTDSVFNQPYKAIVDIRLTEYRTQLAATTSAVLQRTARIRASELSGHYATALRYEQMQGNKDATDRKRIAALCALSAGFIAASIVEYTDRKITGFIEAFTPSLQQEDIERLAASAESQGITDAAAFRELFNASGKVGKSPDKPISRPKDAILNNARAVAKLKILVDSGFCDSEYGWIKAGHTNYQRATAASIIGLYAKIDRYYAAFEDLWGCKYLSSDKTKATTLKTPEAVKKVDEIRKLLDN